MHVLYFDKNNKVLSEDTYKATKEGTANLTALEVAEIRAKALADSAKEEDRIIVTELSAKEFLAEESKQAAANKKAADDIAAAAARDVTE